MQPSYSMRTTHRSDRARHRRGCPISGPLPRSEGRTGEKPMRRAAAAASLALALAASPAAGQDARSPAPLQVREIGSFHIGGRIATVEGLPEREIVFSAGAPPTRINPNGPFQVEQ